MAKWINRLVNKISVKNAPSGGSKPSGGSGGIAINRDPKAIQVKKVGYQLSNGSGGGGRESFEGPRSDLSMIANAIDRDSYIMQSVMKYKELIFKSGWSLKSKNEQALDYVRLRLSMMAVATLVPTEELFQGIADDIVRYSNSFIVKARAKNGVGLPPGLTALPIPPSKEPIAGYFRLPPQTIEIARDKNGNVTKYKQEVQGADKPIEFRPEDMIHISVNRPVGQAWGDPWLAPVLDDVRLLRKTEENAALMLYRHIFPLLAYTVGLDKPGWEATDEELEALRAVIEDMPTDGAVVLPERHKIEAVQVTAIDGRPYLDYFENRVFAGLGLSQVDFGRGDTANRSTADAMTGIKADRVKGWQQSIQMQIDKYIIEEILVEGGFDPLANPDFDVEFVFNEIELEKKIAKENHEILKWNSNLQTFEETRINLGHDPTADESRLNFQMVGMALAEQASTLKQTENANKPTNQNGTKSGPKKSTESVKEHEAPRVYRVPRDRIQDLSEKLNATYRLSEQDIIDSVVRYTKERKFPVEHAKTLLSSLYYSKEQMLSNIRREAQKSVVDGVSQAKVDAGRRRVAEMNYKTAIQLIENGATNSLEAMHKSLERILVEKLKDAKDEAEAILTVKGIFESYYYRLRFLSRTLLAKSYNYGYAVSMWKYGESELFSQPGADQPCASCLEHAQKGISLHRVDEFSLFYLIPPWHQNCECEVTLNDGGEI